MSEQENMFLDWNDSIESDGQEFIVLDEGDYVFRVTNFERGRFAGSEKIPPCNKAIITADVLSDKGKATIRFDLIMYKSMEWRLSAFFRCIGQKKHGEKLTMDWNKVVGSYGLAHVIQRKYTNQYGEEKTINDIDKFIDFKPENFMSEVKDGDLPF